MEVSIILVTYNSEETILDCLLSVDGNLRRNDEVIVVDNSSNDKTIQIIEIFVSFKSQFKFIKNQSNIGFSAGTNVGIKNSSNPYVVLLNPDTIVTKDWLDHLMAHFNDKDIAAVGPVSNYVAGKQKMEFYQKENFAPGTPYYEVATKFYDWLKGCSVETKLLIGFCVMIRRDVLNGVGLLDEELFLGNDDLELSWRLRVNGFKLKVAVDTFIYHEGQKSFETQSKSKTTLLVQQSTDALYNKLQNYYGVDNVPTPIELWGIEWFKPTISKFNLRSKLINPRIEAVENNISLAKIKSSQKPVVSIIVLTLNQLEHTKKCLLSIERHTHVNYELIIVDNGSCDDTLNYMRNYVAQHNNVKLISNTSNKGFAFGNNQGMSIAKGKYLMLLNNDTVVTDGWIERMTSVFEQEPKTGIVGPMSNYVSGLQLVSRVNYKTILEMDRFAAEWAIKGSGKSIPVTHIVGFCLLVKRDVVEQIGGLDTEFGSGNFEDDDYCLRASIAGYETRVVIDVFIHHTGSQTFKGANIDYQKSMLRNWEVFKDKWGIPAETQYEKSFKRPVQLPHAVSKFVDLPDITQHHQQDINNNRWWNDMSEVETEDHRERHFSV